MLEKDIVDPQHAYNQVSWERECNLVATWVDLAVTASRHSYQHGSTRHGRHLSVALASRAFEMIRLRIAASYSLADAHTNEAAAIVKLLSHVVDSLCWSLVHSRADYGAYTPLPWIKDIVQCYEAAQAAHNPNRWDPLQTVALTGNKQNNVAIILRLFKMCIDRRILTDVTSDVLLRRLLVLLDHPTLPELSEEFIRERSAMHDLAGKRREAAIRIRSIATVGNAAVV